MLERTLNRTTRIGISTWVYFWRPLEETLRKIAKVGYPYVELWGDEGHLDPTVFSGILPLRRLLNKLQLQVYSLHAPFTYANIAALDEEERKYSIQTIRKSIEFCSKLEGKVVIIHPHSTKVFPSLKDSSKMIDSIERSLGELTTFAGECNIKIALENLPFLGEWEFGSEISDLKKLVTKIGRNELGLCLDTGHSLIGKAKVDLSQMVFECEKKLIALHIQDTDGKKDRHWLPGEGIINWTQFAKALRSVNYQGIFTLEISGSEKWTGQNVNAILERGLIKGKKIFEEYK